MEILGLAAKEAPRSSKSGQRLERNVVQFCPVQQ
jgi:hypothetical protein